jgi:hypothetical protein
LPFISFLFVPFQLIAASVYNVFFCCLIVVPLLFFLGSSSDFLVGRVVLQAIVILWCSAFPVLALMAPKLLLLWRRRNGTGGDDYGTNGVGSGLVSGDGSNGTALHTGAPHGRYGPRASIVMPLPKRGSMVPSVGTVAGVSGIAVSGMMDAHSRRQSTTTNGNVSLAPPAARWGAGANNSSVDSLRPRADSVQHSGGGAPSSHLQAPGGPSRPHNSPLPSFVHTRRQNGSASQRASPLPGSTPTTPGGVGGLASPTAGSGAPQTAQQQGRKRFNSASSASVTPAPALASPSGDERLLVAAHSPQALPVNIRAGDARASLDSSASPSSSPPLAAVGRLHARLPAPVAPVVDAVVPFEPSTPSASPSLSPAPPALASAADDMPVMSVAATEPAPGGLGSAASAPA